MHSLLVSFHVYVLLIFLKSADTYVLVAANLNDIKTVARRIIPENLVEQIAHAVSDLTIKGTIKSPKPDQELKEISYEESNANEEREEPQLRGRLINEDRKTSKMFKKINFEQLVKKVKKRLENEFKNNLKGSNHTITRNTRKAKSKTYKMNDFKKVNPTQKTVASEDESNDLSNKQISVQRDKVIKPNQPQNSASKPKKMKNFMSKSRKTRDFAVLPKTTQDDVVRPKNTRNVIKHTNGEGFVVKPLKQSLSPTFENTMEAIYREPEKHKGIIYEKNKVFADLTYPEPTANEGTSQANIFEEKYLTNKDSYEEYATPAKEKAFEIKDVKNLMVNLGEENKILNQITSKNVLITSKIKQKLFRKLTTEPSTVKQQIEELYEGETEKTVASNEIEAKTQSLWFDSRDVNDELKTGKPTKIPIKHRFTIKTPDFIKQTTSFAEKYDFNEPLPEADRVRENLTFFGDPLVKINKKVKLF